MTARSSAGAASSGAGGKEPAAVRGGSEFAVRGGSEFPLPGRRFWAIIGKVYLTDPRHCPVLLKSSVCSAAQLGNTPKYSCGFAP